MIPKKEPAGNLRQRMIEEMQLRRFSERTIESYVRAVGRLAGWCWKSPGEVGDEELRDYFLYLRNQKRLARATTTIALPPLRHPHGAARTHLAAHPQSRAAAPDIRPRTTRRLMIALVHACLPFRRPARRPAPLCPVCSNPLAFALPTGPRYVAHVPEHPVRDPRHIPSDSTGSGQSS